MRFSFRADEMLDENTAATRRLIRRASPSFVIMPNANLPLRLADAMPRDGAAFQGLHYAAAASHA